MEFWIQQKMMQYASSCRSATSRICNAKSMREVKLTLNGVYAAAEIHSIHHTISEHRAMHLAADQRMKELLQEQLKELDQLQDLEAIIAARGRLISTEWQSLRGEFAHIYRQGEREVALRIHAVRINS